jgi:hypothetical protein
VYWQQHGYESASNWVLRSIPIQLEDTGFVSSSSNTKPGGFLRGKRLVSPLDSTGYTACHSNTSRTFLRDNALTETSVLKGERYIKLSSLTLDIINFHNFKNNDP